MGAPNWSNTSRVFDAVKLQLRGSGARLDLISGSVVRNDPDRRLNRSVEGEFLHGLYGSLEKVIPKSTLEPYLLWQTKPSVVNELNAHGDLDRYTLGFRAWAKGLGPWDYNAALVRQWGQAAGSEIRAWGYYGELGYSIEARLNPRLYVHYNYGSGDKDPEDGRFGGFVNLYPTTAFFVRPRRPGRLAQPQGPAPGERVQAALQANATIGIPLLLAGLQDRCPLQPGRASVGSPAPRRRPGRKGRQRSRRRLHRADNRQLQPGRRPRTHASRPLCQGQYPRPPIHLLLPVHQLQVLSGRAAGPHFSPGRWVSPGESAYF